MRVFDGTVRFGEVPDGMAFTRSGVPYIKSESWGIGLTDGYRVEFRASTCVVIKPDAVLYLDGAPNES